MKPNNRKLKEIEPKEDKFLKVAPNPYSHIKKAGEHLSGTLLALSEAHNEVQLAIQAFEKLNKQEEKQNGKSRTDRLER